MIEKHPGPYLDVDMPPRFALEIQLDDGDWMLEAVCAANQFDRTDDGAYICSSFSSGLWIRCVERHADHFVHIDGGGKTHRYRIKQLPEQP